MKIILCVSLFISLQAMAGPQAITIQEAMNTVQSVLPAGEYLGTGCKVTVKHDALSDGRDYLDVVVGEEQPDGSYDLYHAGTMFLNTRLLSVLSITKDVSAAGLSLVLKSQGAMDSNGPVDPAWIVTDSLYVTSDTVTLQSSPKPAYSCKIR
jgi:hypothetical protein